MSKQAQGQEGPPKSRTGRTRDLMPAALAVCKQIAMLSVGYTRTGGTCVATSLTRAHKPGWPMFGNPWEGAIPTSYKSITGGKPQTSQGTPPCASTGSMKLREKPGLQNIDRRRLSSRWQYERSRAVQGNTRGVARALQGGNLCMENPGPSASASTATPTPSEVPLFRRAFHFFLRFHTQSTCPNFVRPSSTSTWRHHHQHPCHLAFSSFNGAYSSGAARSASARTAPGGRLSGATQRSFTSHGPSCASSGATRRSSSSSPPNGASSGATRRTSISEAPCGGPEERPEEHQPVRRLPAHTVEQSMEPQLVELESIQAHYDANILPSALTFRLPGVSQVTNHH
jgi:hypothetical protein